MATRKTKTIAVDEKFFNNVFEKYRRDLQKQLGIMNLSQANFTSMIQGLKMTPLKKPIQIKIKNRRKRNDFLTF